jgi:hypothetical protein
MTKRTFEIMNRGKLSDRPGNVLDAKEEYICHQCNCVTKVAKGLAKDLFERYPDANVYTSRKTYSVPGTISVHGTIVNMFAQINPGKPNLQGRDTVENRLAWFKSCLFLIQDLEPGSIAMPWKIGCGLAGGDWSVYKSMLTDFSYDSGIDIVLYDNT